MLIYGRNQHNIVKQLFNNNNKNLCPQCTFFLLPLKKESLFFSWSEACGSILIQAEVKSPGLGGICEEKTSGLIMVPSGQCFPVGSEVKVSACNAGDLGSIPGSGRSPGGGNGNPLQYSRLETPMDGGAWWATVHGVAQSWTRLSDFTHSLTQKYS